MSFNFKSYVISAIVIPMLCMITSFCVYLSMLWKFGTFEPISHYWKEQRHDDVKRMLELIYELDEDPNLRDQSLQAFKSQIDKNKGKLNLNSKRAMSDPSRDPAIKMTVDKIINSDIIAGKIDEFFEEVKNHITSMDLKANR